MDSRRPVAAFCIAASLLLPALADAQPSPDAAFRAFLQDELRADREYFPDTKYALAWADLNGDGKDEALAYLMSGNHCGSGGCNLHVYTPDGGSWRKIGDISIANPPIRLLNTRSRGWRDIGIFVAGGGGASYPALLPFDGAAYPDNPSGPPARRLRQGVRGRVLISENDRGRPLF